MPSNYQQTSLNGAVTTYKRPNVATFQKNLNEVANVNITEETVITLPDNSVVCQPAGVLTTSLTDVTVSFNLLDDTGAIIGTATYQQLLTMLHSAYVDLATKRDAAQGS